MCHRGVARRTIFHICGSLRPTGWLKSSGEVAQKVRADGSPQPIFARGKSTVLTQFHERFPDYIHLITDFTSLSPANLIVKMGEFIGLPLKLRSSEIFTLQDRLRSMSGVMYLMD